jgi:hypothetical protein
MTPQEIEKNAPTWTIQMVIDQLMLLNEETKKLPFSVYSSEYGNEPYHGIFKVQDGLGYFTAEWTPEMEREYYAFRIAEDDKRRHEHWNRPEVQEAKEKGLLP